MYSNINNKAYITGQNGAYDGIIYNPAVKYGKNAINNYKEYIKKLGFEPAEDTPPDIKGVAGLNEDTFETRMDALDDYISKLEKNLKTLAPVKFQYKYSESSKLNTQSLIAASHEELGAESISVKELDKTLNEAFGTPDVTMSVEACDLNKDGQIDLAEYSTTILLQDELSTGKVDGIVNNDGENMSLTYANKQNSYCAAQIYRNYYNAFNLGKAQQEFLSNKNNLKLVG